jgi:hypothetical protein
VLGHVIYTNEFTLVIAQLSIRYQAQVYYYLLFIIYEMASSTDSDKQQFNEEYGGLLPYQFEPELDSNESEDKDKVYDN